MRVVAGTLKGRVIKAPAGDQTRPTTDRVREAMFSSLIAHRGSLEGLIVCDAFGGSGALGIEALSRGAREAYFFEKSPRVCGVIKENLSSLGLRDRARVVVADSLKKPARLAESGPFDLLFLDPPYRITSDEVNAVLDELVARKALRQGAIIVYEHTHEKLFEPSDQMTVIQEKRYGETVVTLCSLAGDEE